MLSALQRLEALPRGIDHGAVLSRQVSNEGSHPRLGMRSRRRLVQIPGWPPQELLETSTHLLQPLPQLVFGRLEVVGAQPLYLELFLQHRTEFGPKTFSNA